MLGMHLLAVLCHVFVWVYADPFDVWELHRTFVCQQNENPFNDCIWWYSQINANKTCWCIQNDFCIWYMTVC